MLDRRKTKCSRLCASRQGVGRKGAAGRVGVRGGEGWERPRDGEASWLAPVLWQVVLQQSHATSTAAQLRLRLRWWRRAFKWLFLAFLGIFWGESKRKDLENTQSQPHYQRLSTKWKWRAGLVVWSLADFRLTWTCFSFLYVTYATIAFSITSAATQTPRKGSYVAAWTGE